MTLKSTILKHIQSTPFVILNHIQLCWFKIMRSFRLELLMSAVISGKHTYLTHMPIRIPIFLKKVILEAFVVMVLEMLQGKY